MGLPGAGAYKIFHPVLMSKSLDCFSLLSKLKLGVGVARRGKKCSQQSQSQSQSHRRRQVSGGTQAGELEEEEEELTQREAEKVVMGLSEVLSSLHVMLDTFSLKRSEESLETVVTHLVTVTRLETQFSQFDCDGPARPGDVTSLAVKAYLALTKLCSPLHGTQDAGAVAVVFRSLIPSILMVGEGTNKALSVIRAHSLRSVM